MWEIRRFHHDGVLSPSLISADQLHDTLLQLLGSTAREAIDASVWDQGRYRPTPTIVEAASALYRGHSVADISRSDAGSTNLTTTSAAVAKVIESSRAERRKSICLVTGVPGAGKTLVGLDVATRYLDTHSDLHGVFLSGNGPLVAILREALARDDVQQAKDRGQKKTKGNARQAVKTFIQPVHHFRDECLKDSNPPHEHVTIFDESQRAWNREKTADFMKRKRGIAGFAMSEPEFLISCLDRHSDWAVIVCLVGGGQEINTGEAGVSEWIYSHSIVLSRLARPCVTAFERQRVRGRGGLAIIEWSTKGSFRRSVAPVGLDALVSRRNPVGVREDRVGSRCRPGGAIACIVCGPLPDRVDPRCRARPELASAARQRKRALWHCPFRRRPSGSSRTRSM